MDGDVNRGPVEGLEHDLRYARYLALGFNGAFVNNPGFSSGGGPQLILEGVVMTCSMSFRSVTMTCSMSISITLCPRYEMVAGSHH